MTKIKHRKKLTVAEKGIIIGHHKDGLSYKKIAELEDVSRSTVEAVVQEYKKTGTVSTKIGCGRKRLLDAKQVRDIKLQIKRNRNISIPEIQKVLDLEHVSSSTISRAIHGDKEFTSYWTAVKPLLSKANVKKRLQWAKEHKDWTVEQWNSVLWSDESPFDLVSKGKRRVWRRHNERYSPNLTKKTVKHSARINVWGCFCGAGLGKLQNIEGNLDTTKYLAILENTMLPSKIDLFGRKDWIFQQDNDPKHTAGATKEWLQRKRIEVMEWPPQSPDLNPIENVWSIMHKNMGNKKPRNVSQLLKCVQRAWNEVDVDYLKALVNSMPKRCEAVIAEKGQNTKY